MAFPDFNNSVCRNSSQVYTLVGFIKIFYIFGHFFAISRDMVAIRIKFKNRLIFRFCAQFQPYIEIRE